MVNVSGLELLRDANGVPLPQYYDTVTKGMAVITGREGANAFIEKGRIVKDVFGGTSTITKTYDTPMFGFGIVNDGVADLTFSVNQFNILVKQNESFDDLFEPFQTVTITATDAFRAVVRE